MCQNPITMIKIKPGVSIANLTPQMSMGNQIVASVFDDHDEDCYITSGCEGRHGRASLHFAGNALDYRLPDIQGSVRGIETPAGWHREILRLMKECLGKQYDAVLEKDHFHVEYQPKKGVNQ